jgi:hypothetical protein
VTHSVLHDSERQAKDASSNDNWSDKAKTQTQTQYIQTGIRKVQ